MKKFFALIMSALFVLATLASAAPAFAQTEDGTAEKPYVGGHNFEDPYEGRIVLTKFDISKFEKDKAAEIKNNEGVDVTVKYHGNSPAGKEIAGNDVIGFYTRSDENPTDDPSGTTHPVTRSHLAQLNSVPFRIESVEYSGTGDKVDPTNYIAAGSIDSYAKTDINGVIDWTGLPQGYYRVTEIENSTGTPVGKSSFIVAVPTSVSVNGEPSRTIYVYPKNRATDAPTIEKSDPELVGGNKYHWTVKSELPKTMKEVEGLQKYIITDTMSNGLTYANTLKVYYKPVDGGAAVELIKGTDYTETLDEATPSTTPTSYKLTVQLTAAGFAKLAANNDLPSVVLEEDSKYYLYMEYDTEINLTEQELKDLAAAQKNPNNDVNLDFTNDNGANYTDEEDQKEVDEFAAVKIFKYDGTNKKELAGAQFEVYTEAGGVYTPVTTLQTDGTLKPVVLTTDAQGNAFYASLAPDTKYYLKEIAAPAGYKVLEGYKEFTTGVAQSITDVSIDNFLDNGLTLPSTGGMGTAMFIAIGAFMLGLALIVFKANRKRTA